jgi:TIR domain
MKKKQVFISYFHGDRDIAAKIASIYKRFNVTIWIDFESIRPGEFIAQHIEEGIRSSSYFTIVISAKSVSSRWVQAELAMAFDLSKDGRVTLVPARVDKVEMPLELRGLLYIDFSASFEEGASQLTDFLRSEDKKPSSFASGTRGRVPGPPTCEDRLLALDIADLRFEISRRLTKEELGVIWFDTLESKMDNEINPISTGLIATELIHRSQSRRRMDRLVRYLCRERPDFQRE